MILQKLYEYYNRLGTLPPPGSELKEIEYVIVIDRNGKFKRFESKRIDKKKCASFIVPKGVGRTSAPKANSLWDNGKYVLGLAEDHKASNSLFVEKINEIAERNPDDASVQAVKRFYDIPDGERMLQFECDPLFDAVQGSLSSNFSFQLEGDDCLVAEKLSLAAGNDESADDSIDGICLITGKYGPLARLTSATPIPGNSPGAALVGMQVNSGYDSYGKSQAYNAPISKDAEFCYTSALKALLGKDSHNKLKVGDRIFLFWGSGEDSVVNDVENSFWDLSYLDFEKVDDPNESIDKIQELYKSIWSGKIKTTLDDRFYILGLAPNVGRIAVVSWDDMSLKDFSEKILQHFSDMEIGDSRKPDHRKPYTGIFTMLSNITLSGKSTDAPSCLVEATLKAIISAVQYPFALYTSALERIRNSLHEQSVSIGRAAILKAYINRSQKYNTQSKPLEVMLDKTNDNPGYVCGRLTAVLEHIQSCANGGDSIRSTFMTAASSTPTLVFPSMMSLSNHHLEKLSTGSRIYYEQLKQEIFSLLPSSGFPARLDLIDQGRFFVGYYHQRLDLFTKKEDKQHNSKS